MYSITSTDSNGEETIVSRHRDRKIAVRKASDMMRQMPEGITVTLRNHDGTEIRIISGRRNLMSRRLYQCPYCKGTAVIGERCKATNFIH